MGEKPASLPPNLLWGKREMHVAMGGSQPPEGPHLNNIIGPSKNRTLQNQIWGVATWDLKIFWLKYRSINKFLQHPTTPGHLCRDTLTSKGEPCSLQYRRMVCDFLDLDLEVQVAGRPSPDTYAQRQPSSLLPLPRRGWGGPTDQATGWFGPTASSRTASRVMEPLE